MELKKRSEKERIAYLVRKYFTDEIDLDMLKLQINSVETEYAICPTCEGKGCLICAYEGYDLPKREI